MVIQDTKEKLPWDFSIQGIEQIKSSLKTGDYTIEGYEDLLCIERKRTTGEVSVNIGMKRKQFFNEMERMQSYKYRYIICEFSWEDVMSFPTNSGIPKSKIPHLRISKNFLVSSLNKIENEFNVSIIYAGSKDRAQNSAVQIFKEVILNGC